MDGFTDRKRVAKGFVAALLGVVAYCVAIAPLVHGGSYLETTMHALRTTGLGLGGAIAILGVIWVVLLSLKQDRV